MFKKCLAAAAVAILVAACGGGSDTPTAAATPQAMVEALRAQSAALSPMAVTTPAAAAEQLMNFGEANFPGFFPSHKTTQTSAPFAYRYYPETGIYLGVVVTQNNDFQLYGVYVMGGSFGNAPVYVGQMTQFINVDLGSGGGGASNGCYDLALADTQGTRMEVTYQYVGDITGTMSSDTVVGGIVPFQAYQARETRVNTTGTTVTNGMSVNSTYAIKNYSVRSGTAEITQYGSTLNGSSTVAGITSTMVSTNVFAPPYLDRQYSLGVGQTYTASQTLNTTGTMTTMGYVQPLDGSSTSTINLKYVGQESVTVPAGTYNACRMETTSVSNGTTSVQTSWIVVGKGIPVKTTVTGGGVNQTIQATSVRLNGASL